MAGSGKLTASFVLKLEDQLSNGLGKLTKTLETLGGLAKKLSFNDQFMNADQKFDGMTAGAGKLARELATVQREAHGAAGALRRMYDAGARGVRNAGHWMGQQIQGLHANPLVGAAAGYSVMAPIRPYAEYENTLRHIAITEKLSGAAVEKEIKRLTGFINHDALATGNSSTDVARAYSDLLLSGISKAEVDKLIPIHSRAATAYNISTESMGQAVYALSSSFKIPAEQMEGALSAMALAAKGGKFKVEDFSHFLPEIGANMQKLGMTGRGSADKAFAALETVRMTSPDAGTAATNLRGFLDYIVSPFGQRSFKKAGIDLSKLLLDSEKKGLDPMESVIQELSKKMTGMTQIQKSLFLGTAFHNMEARNAALGLVQNKDAYILRRDDLGHSSTATMLEDFNNAARSPLVQLRIMGEVLDQLIRRFGEGFVPVLMLVNRTLLGVNSAFQWLDKFLPGVSQSVIVGTGAFLALVAVIGVLSFLLPAIAGAIALLTSPIGLVIAAVGLLALTFYEEWGALVIWFDAKVNAAKEIFHGLYEFVAGVFTLDWHRAIAGLTEFNLGISDWFKADFELVKTLFTDIILYITGGVDRLRSTLDTIQNSVANTWAGRQLGIHPTGDFFDQGGGPRGAPGALGASGAVPAAPAPAQLTGNITISVDPWTGAPVVQSATFDQPGVTASAPDRGKVLDRH